MMSVTSHGQSHKGLVRQLNEDACLLLPEHGVWVVADGMGGHAAGDVASQLVITTIHEEVAKTDEPKPETICTALERANERVVEYCQQHNQGELGGSTVVVLLFYRQQYHVFWLGDSRLYLLRNNALRQITRDHSQVNDMIDQGIIAAEEAETHELANVITRAVGVQGQVSIASLSGDIEPGDIFLLCTDGLNKELSDAEIQSYLHHTDIEAANRALIHMSLVAGARDNVTCILVKVNNLHSHCITDNYISSECNKTVPVYLKR
ncbi:protein phosphatase 2C domain-containing protein [Alkalimonas sp.]|uniref:PP2C family protein-serine/threonine phosphatase n=1 Tax=Alkalimonas sp. TaxID=1872453 RepID=UPI00263A6C38|nr:protein phosphatase 2C domain-containing protein [Alkalimonas sp.]MCC5825379.1 serine/threonine-protein phosphatase [Alkalimonas sp.]